MEQDLEIKDNELEYSRCLVTLMRGVIEQETQPALWNYLLDNQARVAEYFEKISLRLYLDKGIGYAYLRQIENDNLPRLVNRYPLSYGLSMLLIILRKSLGDYDSSSGDSFYVIKKSDIHLKMKVFFPTLTNETKYIQEIERHIKKAIEMGFLAPIKSNKPLAGEKGIIQDESYKVKEIIRSFITASWLKSFDERLSEYIAGDEKKTSASTEKKRKLKEANLDELI